MHDISVTNLSTYITCYYDEITRLGFLSRGGIKPKEGSVSVGRGSVTVSRASLTLDTGSIL